MADHGLRLSIDVAAVPNRPTGAGQYALQLVRALSDRSDVDLVLFARRTDGTRWHLVAPGAEVVAAAPEPRPFRLAWEQVRLGRLLTRQGISVHHGPHYTMPERSSVPTTVTVHDLSFFEAPQWHQRSKALLFRRAISVAARRASALVCPSRTTAGQLDRWCRVNAEVFVAHHGVDTHRFRTDEPHPGADAARLLRLDPRLGDGRPYLVFVGTLEPRKDVPTLVGSFARIADRHPDALLVLAGGSGWGGNEIDRAIDLSGIAPRIIRTGYVEDDAVPALLRSTVAAVYPSLYEGFGLPALEALACGARLVTTTGTAMEEVAGDVAVLVGPGDFAGLADAIDAELTDQPVRSSAERGRRARGLEIVARHTWRTSADRHLDAYRHAARQPGGSEHDGPGT